MRYRKILSLIIIGILVYGNTLLNGFVWDDEVQILQNTYVHSLTNISTYFLNSDFAGGGAAKPLIGIYYRPIMKTLFSAIYTVVGPQAWAFHLIQIILHIAVGILLYLLFNRLLKHELLAWFLATAFLVHPINSETVVYVANYQDVLFVLFGLLSLFSPTPVVSALLLFVSLLSKETGVVMIAIAVIYRLLYWRKKIEVFFVSLAGILFLYVVLRFAIAQSYLASPNKFPPISNLTLAWRLVNIPAIIFYYLKTFFWASTLTISQIWVVRTITWTSFTLPLIIDSIFFGLLGLCAIILKGYRSKWLIPFLFFSFWFILALGFHLQLFPLDLTVSDRWFYLPIIGLLGTLGSFLLFLKSRCTISPQVRAALICLAAIILMLLASRTFIRTFDWRNSLTLYGHDIRISPDSFNLETNYAVELLNAGRLDEAATHIKHSLLIEPIWRPSLHTLSIYYIYKGDLPEAELLLNTLIGDDTDYQARQNLGFVLIKEKKYQKAVDLLKKSVKTFPQNRAIMRNLIIAYYKNGQKNQALDFASRLYGLDPTSQNQMLYEFIEENKDINLTY